MKITYKDLKKQLDESIKNEFDPNGEVPMWWCVERVAIGKLRLTDFLNACGDYCSHEQAIEYYEASLILEPYQPVLNFKLARNYYLSNRSKKALKCIDEAIRVDATKSKNKVKHLELKQTILINLRRFSEALFLFEQIDTLNPNSSAAYFNRGKAFVELGFYEKAIHSFLKAMDLDPDSEKIPYHLAKLYKYHLLDEELAAKYYSMADKNSKGEVI